MWLWESRACVQRAAGRSYGTPGGFCYTMFAPQMPCAVDFVRAAGAVSGTALLAALTLLLWLDGAQWVEEGRDESVAGESCTKREACRARWTPPAALLLAVCCACTAPLLWVFLLTRGMDSDGTAMLAITNSDPVTTAWGWGVWLATAGAALSLAALLSVVGLRWTWTRGGRVGGQEAGVEEGDGWTPLLAQDSWQGAQYA